MKTVLEQLDILGEDVVPVLREEFAKNRPAGVPEAPTHARRVAEAQGQSQARSQAQSPSQQGVSA